MGGEHPGRPQDGMPPARVAHQSLAGELGGPVDPERPGRIVLPPRPARRAVEDVVGGDMQEGQAPERRRPGHRAGRRGIHRLRDLRLGFRLVHRGIGGRIDDGIRIGPGDQPGAIVGREKIGVPAAERGHLHPVARRAPDELAPDLARGAEDEEPRHRLAGPGDRRGHDRRLENEGRGPVAKRRQAAVLLRQDHGVGTDVPVDAEVRVVPDNAHVRDGAVEIVDLVDDLRVRLRGSGSRAGSRAARASARRSPPRSRRSPSAPRSASPCARPPPHRGSPRASPARAWSARRAAPGNAGRARCPSPATGSRCPARRRCRDRPPPCAPRSRFRRNIHAHRRYAGA